MFLNAVEKLSQKAGAVALFVKRTVLRGFNALIRDMETGGVGAECVPDFFTAWRSRACLSVCLSPVTFGDPIWDVGGPALIAKMHVSQSNRAVHQYHGHC